MGLTTRNWLIGLYIVEFEQNGEDRARYGAALTAHIAKIIRKMDLQPLNYPVAVNVIKFIPTFWGH